MEFLPCSVPPTSRKPERFPVANLRAEHGGSSGGSSRPAAPAPAVPAPPKAAAPAAAPAAASAAALEAGRSTDSSIDMASGGRVVPASMILAIIASTRRVLNLVL